MSGLLLQERPEWVIGPFCPQHAFLLDFRGWVRHVTERDVVAYGDAMRGCKWCAHPERYDPPVIAKWMG